MTEVIGERDKTTDGVSMSGTGEGVEVPKEQVAASALDRSLSILDFLATTRGATTGEIAAAVRVSRSTTYRLVERLRQRGYVDDIGHTGVWHLGPAAARLALAAVQSSDVAQVAPEYLRMLVQQTRESVNLGVPRGTEMVFIYRDKGPQTVAVHGDVGARRPMHCTSVGKAYLAALPQGERDQILSKMVYHAFTPKTITTRAALEEEIQRTIDRGWSEDHGEIDPSSTCCGAAIRDNMGRPVAAISVAGVTDRISPELSRIGAVVASTAEAISRRLGYDPAINYTAATTGKRG
ncbi:IclR family transcriptional regulator [Arthrobacter sp. AB6]|uniref:IclR family transcriptional regulator n=1 Tax=Arthrobacter sp. AB6 TaxID=2962570 RepID=UPI002882804B|nr:IclR family transcriptional regulator [Arthrobacter sp. AB6]MDT0196739.1 IclR family transcriptional regulator [Arthrobacter sp. AB6]